MNPVFRQRSIHRVRPSQTLPILVCLTALLISACWHHTGLDPQYELALVNREIVKTLEEGQRLEAKTKIVEYYKDYSLKK